MNSNNYLKKKDIIVIFINLLVLTLFVYIYYVVENLKTILANKTTSMLKTSMKADLTESNLEEIYLHRYTRSTNSMKFQNSSLFTLAQPNIDFEQNGILGPWILTNKSLLVDKNLYPPIKLMSRRTLLEIVDEGLYLVHIQVYYLSSSTRNSFAVTKITSNVNETLTVCSAMGVHGTEISCFTSIVEYFKTGESILVRLREMSSSISLNRKVSHTYLGFTKLL